jgi:hypothetical protein
VVALAFSKVDVVLKVKSGTRNEKAEAKNDEKICKKGMEKKTELRAILMFEGHREGIARSK